jgi:hypothetical protein
VASVSGVFHLMQSGDFANNQPRKISHFEILVVVAYTFV